MNKKWGVIDTKGNLAVNLEYDDVGEFSQDVVWAKKGTDFGIVSNNQFIAIEGADFIGNFNASSYTFARKKHKFGFINKKGEWIIAPVFSNAKSFSNGLAPIEEKGKWGFINEGGEVVIQPKYNNAEVFSELGLAPVKEGGKWGFVNKTGQLVIPALYDISVSFGFSQKDKGFNGQLARVKKQGKWSFLDENGNVLADKWFDNAELFNE